MHGIVVLDKSIGVTSNGALQQVRRLLAARKAGHTGSLDPLATGVLPLCFGEATKYSHFLLDAVKTYVAEGRFGTLTDTGDAQGNVVQESAVPELSAADFESLCRSFQGSAAQVPPMFSALKRDGRPLYELARQGLSVERPARSICIVRCESLELGLPHFRFRVTCSKGTYVRTLVEDMAKAVGAVAHLTALRREVSGPFDLAQAVSATTLEALAGGREPRLVVEHLRDAGYLMSIDQAVVALPALELRNDQVDSLICGRTVTLSHLQKEVPEGAIRLYRESDRLFVGIGICDEARRVIPQRMISRLLIEEGNDSLGRL